MDLEWCQGPEKGLLKPDLVFLLTLSEEEMVKRPKYGSEIYENQETQEKVAKTFMKMSDEEKWEVICADGAMEEVHKVLLDKVMKKMSEVGTHTLDTLNF